MSNTVQCDLESPLAPRAVNLPLLAIALCPSIYPSQLFSQLPRSSVRDGHNSLVDPCVQMIDIPVPNSDFRKLTFSSRIRYKGASIYYVRKIFGILDPLPPLCSHFTQPISTVIRKFGHFLNSPPPSRCERNKWILCSAKLGYFHLFGPNLDS